MSEFKEQEFIPTVDSLQYLKRKIDDAGLLFHPFMVIQSIDNEKQRQFSEIVLDHFKGMKVSKLEECKEDVAKYIEEEQKRWDELNKAKIDSLDGAPTPIALEEKPKKAKKTEKTK